jgi:hypothetical protein
MFGATSQQPAGVPSTWLGGNQIGYNCCVTCLNLHLYVALYCVMFQKIPVENRVCDLSFQRISEMGRHSSFVFVLQIYFS